MSRPEGHRAALGLALVLAAGGCITQDATMVEILHAVEPDATCLFQPSNGISSYGTYDPLIDDTGYRLTLVLRNNLEARTDDQQVLAQTNLREKTNAVEVVGFEGCWYQFQGDVAQFKAYRGGQIVDCATLPGQSGSIPAAGQLEEGGQTETVVQVNVLDRSQLAQIFGADLDLTKVPPVGITAGDTNGDGVISDPNVDRFLSASLASPEDLTSRAPAWGSKWPQTLAAPVVVQLRAVGRLAGGGTVTSNYFPFMIFVCPSCVQTACGPLPAKACAGPCPDGTPCVNNTCAGGSPCPTRYLFSGFLPTFTGAAACLPAQAYTPPDCITRRQGC